MAVMMGDLYSASVKAGAGEEEAKKAAEEVAGFENGLASLDARVLVLTWMVGFNLATTVAIVGKLFLIGR